MESDSRTLTPEHEDAEVLLATKGYAGAKVWLVDAEGASTVVLFTDPQQQAFTAYISIQGTDARIDVMPGWSV